MKLKNNIKFLEERIARLENELKKNNLPTEDKKCPCCGNIWLPSKFDEIKCRNCHSCYIFGNDNNKDIKWIKGKYCPSHLS